MSETLSQVLFQCTIDEQYKAFDEFENLIGK